MAINVRSSLADWTRSKVYFHFIFLGTYGVTSYRLRGILLFKTREKRRVKKKSDSSWKKELFGKKKSQKKGVILKEKMY